MRLIGVIVALSLGLIVSGRPTFAHHAVSAEFDLKKLVTLQGRVTKIEWMNPHVYLYVEVSVAGKTVNWACETAGPNALARQGWSRLSLKIGDRVTVVGYGARDGSNVASAREIVLADGRKLYVGSPHELNLSRLQNLPMPD